MIIPEPYRIKAVEPIRLIPRPEREIKLRQAHYNLFNLRSEDVFIDLLTDSGTGAMSDCQWAGLMRGDEAYAGSRSYYNLESSCRDVFGHRYFVPAHQGRGAENVLFPLLIKPGQMVIGNMHFDTTRAHIELKGGQAVDCVVPEAYDTSDGHPFKGNVDINRLEGLIDRNGPQKVAFLLVTVTCNSAGGQPVSLSNLRQVRRVADKYNLPLFLDAARFAENAYFIKKREQGCEAKSIREIVREMFSLADGFTMSAKKDGLVNIGGLIGIKENRDLYNRVRANLVPIEGFPTYGGLAGRDMEALALGLQEVVEESYLQARVGQVEYLGKRLLDAGIPIQQPVGGHAVFVDAGKFLPHIPYRQFPGQALAIDLYLEAGVRAVEIGSFLLGRDPATGVQIRSPLEFLRLTIPRRVYTNSHMDYVAESLAAVHRRRDKVRGVRIVEEPEVLRHFTARLDLL
ncbi:MAG: tryptophanase [Peptococcaceae bacterium]|nr:tryptophanase [Peptococcaceae bacterium]